MKILIVISFLLSTIVASCQLHWEKATNWTLYRYQGHRLFKIPIDSLSNYDSSALNQDSMAVFLASARTLHPEGPVSWMGGYISTCKLDGVVRKVELSNYGGFFYDEKTRVYYQIAAVKSADWLSYIQQNYLNLTKKQPSIN
jgi:hypothetical protein